VTLIEVLRRATGYLEQHGSSSPRLDAELLMAHALNLRRIDLYLQFERPLAEAELQPYRDLIARRGRGEPVAYLVGHKEFMKLDFEVSPAVLVPNPDTETLVVRAIELLRARVERGGGGRGTGTSARVADVGTGSGCIAVSVAHYLPEAEVVASDVSEAALAVARHNAERLVPGRVEFFQGSLLDVLPGDFDLICANLPYLAEWAELPAEVRAQPAEALFAGEDGAEQVRRLLEAAPARLRPGGVLLAEADAQVFAKLRPLVERLYEGHRVHRDLGGHERVLEAWLAQE
jgi:release factor glutamine methyltransferase